MTVDADDIDDLETDDELVPLKLAGVRAVFVFGTGGNETDTNECIHSSPTDELTI